MILVAVFILYAFSLLSKFFIHYYYIYTCKFINIICRFELYVCIHYVCICLCVQDPLVGIGSFRDLSLQQTDCPFHSSHDLTVVLHLWVGPSEITPIHVGIIWQCHFTGLVKAIILLKFHGCSFPVVYRRSYLASGFLVFWPFHNVLNLQYSVGFRCVIWCWVSRGL